jgi:hypothetical protein
MSGIAKGMSVGRPSAIGRIERLLGPSAAALLGAASAFFCFAMPAALVSGLVGALGLPPAVAESRLALAICLGLAVAAATWFGFAALDRAGRPHASSFGALEGEADLAPVLRRADAHPDAPPRRPIFAGSDLGTPLDLIDPLPADWSEPRHSVAPVAAPAIEYAEFQAVAPEPFAPRPARAPVAAVAPAVRADPPAPAAPTAALAPAAPVPTLAAMMARLEAGLVRKSLALAGAEANVTALKREIRPIGGTLRAAVDELQERTAARR